MDAYIILKDKDIEMLQQEVNVFISNGYKPTGGVAINGFVYLQAMMLDETKL